MSVKSLAKAVAAKVVSVVKKEPVAVWGVVAAAVLGVLAGFGVPAATISLIGTLLPLLGIPVVRSRVTPVDAVKAVVEGAVAEKK